MSGAVIWFSQAAHDVNLFPGYEVVKRDGLDSAVISDQRRRLRAGELMRAEDLPAAFEPSRRVRPQKLGRPIFESNYIVVHRDVADVMRRFDMGRTLFKPVAIHLPEGGTNDDYLILATANLRTTIDDRLSAPSNSTAWFRSSLHTEKHEPVHRHVVALPEASEGPDLWTDEGVASTLFLSDPLARALIDAGFNKGRRGGLNLKQVRVGGEPVEGSPADEDWLN